MFDVILEEEAKKQFENLDNSQKIKLNKKLNQLKELKKARHLKHGLPYFVAETGQYRIAFKEKDTTRTIFFIGTHKQYEKWFKDQ